MTKPRKGAGQTRPTSFWELGNPFLAMMLEVDTPNFIFQPSKATALGEIQVLGLVNRRIQACVGFPHELAACRTPQDVVMANLRFYQEALRDYSDAVSGIAEAWDRAVYEQASAPRAAKSNQHDYLSLAPAAAAASRAPRRAKNEAHSSRQDCAV